MKKVLLFLCALVAAQMANAWYLVGIGGDWGTFHAPTKTDGTNEYWENLELSASEQFKITSQASWNGENLGNYGYHDGWMSGGPLTAKTADNKEDNATWKGTAGTYTFMFNTDDRSLTITKVEDAETETLTYRVTVPEGTPACYIAGDMNDWSFTAMTKVDETHYTITYDNVMKSYQYKYTCGTSWSYEEQIGANRTYTANDEVAAWKATELEANITSNTCYLLNIKGIDWTTAGAKFGAWFCNKNINPNKEILVQGEVLSGDTIIMFYLDENHVNDILGETINFTHVTFLRLNSSFAFDESTEYTVFPKDYVWNSVETHCPGVDNYFQLTDWNAGEWRAIPSALDRVELAGGIGYAYGVVSAEGAIEVYNVNGAVVARGNDNVDLRGLGRGVYIIRNGNQVRKVVR